MAPTGNQQTAPHARFSVKAFLSSMGDGRTLGEHRAEQIIYSQGEAADSIFYVHSGKVKLTVISNQGREAVIAILGVGDFFGEGCLLAGQNKRMANATTMSACWVTRIEKKAAIRVIGDEPSFSRIFLQHMLARTLRIEADLVNQLFNSSEKRLARVLLLLANFSEEGQPQPVMAPMSQETLAKIVGTSRSRVNFFMNKFRKMGFISYNGHLEVHSSLLSVVLHD